jgi:hypothetical protein
MLSTLITSSIAEAVRACITTTALLLCWPMRNRSTVEPLTVERNQIIPLQVLGPVPAAATADGSSASANKLHGTKALHSSSSNTNSPYSRRPSASYLIADEALVYGLAVSGSSNALNNSSSSSTTANSSSSRAAPAVGGSSNSHSSNGYSSSGSTSSSSKRGQHTVAHRAARSAAAAAAVVHTGSSSTTVDTEASRNHTDRLSFIGSSGAAADTETASTASASASSSSAGNNSSSSCSSTMSIRERLQFVGSLWPYMLPLCLIYFAEYCMQVNKSTTHSSLTQVATHVKLRILIVVQRACYVTACA